VDKDIHAVQLSFSDDVFNHERNLLMATWRTDSSFAKFCDYFNGQWAEKLCYWQYNLIIPVDLFIAPLSS
jgi:hypothetical protein